MKKNKKSKTVKLIEYAAAYLLIMSVRSAPLAAIKIISRFLGDLLYFLSKKRRGITVENLRHAFIGEKNEKEIRALARKSCRTVFYNYLETIKINYMFTRPDMSEKMRERTRNIDEAFQKARKIHDESGGCIFVTPHLGSWEMLPHVGSSAGIPLIIIARPLDNEYLDKLVYADRTSSGQVVIPKRNALFTLQKTLRDGNSVGMFPDQSTMKGLMIDFFGRPATTTPVPALLAVKYRRPIVVTACCRGKGDYRYEPFVSDPIMPREYTDKKAEIIRLTGEMTRKMESIIRKYPEQYLWMHNRWKTYKDKKEIFSSSNI
jgi:KDO2-lipid IV(A) lauroyltransferase